MSKRPKDGDEGRWPTPSEEYGITPLQILAGDQRESRDEHEAVTTDTKAGSVDDDSFVFDITEHNYIDWSDICVQTTSTQVKLEDNNIQKAVHDSSRSSLMTTNDPERNTKEQCIRLENDIQKSFVSKSITVGVFIDFQKAFDMLWKHGLLQKWHLLIFVVICYRMQMNS